MSKKLKALEALERIKRDHIILDLNKQNDDGSIYKKIEFEEEFSIIEKELKALEIIKNKKVNFRLIYETEIVDDYNLYVGKFINDDLSLTQEEYDLLKEVLG